MVLWKFLSIYFLKILLCFAAFNDYTEKEILQNQKMKNRNDTAVQILKGKLRECKKMKN